VEGLDGLRLEQGVRVAFLIAAVNAFGAVRIFLAQRAARKAERAFSLKRALKLTVVSIVFWQGIWAASLLAYYRTGGWTWSTVGVSDTVPPGVAFLSGVIVYVAFLYVVRLVVMRAGGSLAYLRASLRANAVFLQRDPVKRGIVFAMLMVVNPITEELIFRGLLVHQFALISVPVWVALLIGCLVNSLNHAYQGRLLGWFHLGFYVTAVATLYSPLGLIGCFGLHFAGDTLPFLFQRSSLAKYVALRRQARQSRTAAREVNARAPELLPPTTSRTSS
jgi:membrane protease YdiL (CAAX protease family)